MSENIKTVTLEELIAKKERGEIKDNPDAPLGPDLPDDFWEKAVVVYPQKDRVMEVNPDGTIKTRPTFDSLLAKCDLDAPFPEEDRDWNNRVPVGRELL